MMTTKMMMIGDIVLSIWFYLSFVSLLYSAKGPLSSGIHKTTYQLLIIIKLVWAPCRIGDHDVLGWAFGT
jgi:hypothetical protein